MDNAKQIKEHYMGPAIIQIEHQTGVREGRASKLSCQFEIQTKIWVDQHIPEYRVAIPENFQWRAEHLEHWQTIWPVETRMITYVPTGRVVYDNTKPHKEAVVYEYILETLLGKKDLKHR